MRSSLDREHERFQSAPVGSYAVAWAGAVSHVYVRESLKVGGWTFIGSTRTRLGGWLLAWRHKRNR